MPDTILEIREIVKRFPGMVAVNHVSMDIRKGEVHVLMGENGAGKSTLVKMIAGILPLDGGGMTLDGAPYCPKSVVDAQNSGVNMVHQELSLMPDRTVAQNIYLGREPVKQGLFRAVDRKKMNADAQKLLDELEIPVSATEKVKNLSIARRQMVEMAKALSTTNQILILDEPTSSLTEPEIKSLFRIIHALREKGLGIIYISHRMNEIFQIGDRITIMRDGCYIATHELSKVTTDDIVRMMVGREVETTYAGTGAQTGEVMLETRNLCGMRFRNVSIQVRAGEIVGMAGLVGAGRTEIGKAIYGIDPIEGGELLLGGEKLSTTHHTPTVSISHGMAFIPEDRKLEGLFMDFSISENAISVAMRTLFRGGIVNARLQKKYAQNGCERLNVVTTGIDKAVRGLSGGNQQKVVLARWMGVKNRIYIFDEPTRGIDIGAKTEIYQKLRQLAAQGAAILVISSEMTELLSISDRIYTMKDGELSGELIRGVDEITEQSVLSCMLNGGKKQ